LSVQRIAAIAATGATIVAVCTAAPAAAVDNLKGFGVQETLKSFYNLSDFSSEIGYTVRTLRPSRDPVPFPVAGRLYEADASATAVVGTVFPQPGNFRARTGNGVDYRALPVSTLGAAPLGQGGSNSGKLYFDVVGPNPDSVIYNNGFEDQLGWVGPQPTGPIVPGTDADGGTPAGSAGGGSASSDANGGGQPVLEAPQVASGGAGGPGGTGSPGGVGGPGGAPGPIENRLPTGGGVG
jgi:hypothetical protein